MAKTKSKEVSQEDVQDIQEQEDVQELQESQDKKDIQDKEDVQELQESQDKGDIQDREASEVESVDEVFAANPNLDVYYRTSNGIAFYTSNSAAMYASKLEDKTVTRVTK